MINLYRKSKLKVYVEIMIEKIKKFTALFFQNLNELYDTFSNIKLLQETKSLYE